LHLLCHTPTRCIQILHLLCHTPTCCIC
jgi:hypothetical protein